MILSVRFRNRWMQTVVALCVLCSACNGSGTAPTPTPIPTPIPPTVYALNGTVTATNGHQALPGITAVISSLTTVTDTAGQFSGTLTSSGTFLLALSGSGIVPRSITMAVSSSRSVAIDAITLAGGFDQGFYRQFVRNGFDSTILQPVRRWTRNPSVYIQATTLVDANTIDMVERTIRDAVPRWTAGRFSIAAVERGSGSREGQAGWVTVQWTAGDTGYCGRAGVGAEGGTIELAPQTPRCACDGYGIRPTTVRHESGHAMGFWHTDSDNDVMIISSPTCDKPISARELYHASIAYSRPVGNFDPDTDPTGIVNLAPMRIQ